MAFAQRLIVKLSRIMPGGSETRMNVGVIMKRMEYRSRRLILSRESSRPLILVKCLCLKHCILRVDLIHLDLAGQGSRMCWGLPGTPRRWSFVNKRLSGPLSHFRRKGHTGVFRNCSPVIQAVWLFRSQRGRILKDRSFHLPLKCLGFVHHGDPPEQ